MEKISTPSKTLLPRTTNLATLAVVVAATWWSGAQRPAGQADLAASAVAPAAQAVATTVASRQPAVLATGPHARDGLQTVSYQTRTR
jgi:hypothetical protein